MIVKDIYYKVLNKHETINIKVVIMEHTLISKTSWTGFDKPYLDCPNIEMQDHLVIGCYGGNTNAGANKNEDGFLVWSSIEQNWEFVVLLDAHATCDSASLIIDVLSAQQEVLCKILSSSTSQVFQLIEKAVLDIFTSEQFLLDCKKLNGESSCLICLRKENYLWWFSVGDCMLFLSHAELARWGQTMLNQRNFYEWIGRVNTFQLPVACYSSGRRELRTGTNEIYLVTDGCLDTENGLQVIANMLEGKVTINEFFELLHKERTIDSTTMIYWSVNNPKTSSNPSN